MPQSVPLVPKIQMWNFHNRHLELIDKTTLCPTAYLTPSVSQLFLEWLRSTIERGGSGLVALNS